jgi:hypothetical protein
MVGHVDALRGRGGLPPYRAETKFFTSSSPINLYERDALRASRPSSHPRARLHRTIRRGDETVEVLTITLDDLLRRRVSRSTPLTRHRAARAAGAGRIRYRAVQTGPICVESHPRGETSRLLQRPEATWSRRNTCGRQANLWFMPAGPREALSVHGRSHQAAFAGPAGSLL